MESKMEKFSWGRAWVTSRDTYPIDDVYISSCHRENDLPAVERNDGTKYWLINGKLHRELGPARIYPDGVEEWYLNDVYYTLKKMPIKLFMSYCNWEYKKKIIQ